MKVLAQNVKQRPTRIARSVARRSITVAFSPASRGVSEVLSLRVALVNSATQICDMQETIDALRDQVQALHETLAL